MLLFDLGSKAGDTLSIGGEGDNAESHYHVDSITTFNLNGTDLRQWNLTYIDGCDIVGKRYIEGIGYTNYMLPQFCGADPPTGGDIRCFSHPEWGDYDFEPERDCDYLVLYSSIGQLNNESLKFFPNPVTNHFKVEGLKSDTDYDYQIYSISGQIIQSGTTRGDITTSTLSSGIYGIRLVDKDKTEIIIKMVKH